MRFILCLITLLATASGHAATCDQKLNGAGAPLDYARSVLRGGTAHVKINRRQISRVANVLDKSGYAFNGPTWNFPPYPGGEATFNQMFVYFLTLNSINYMYRDPVTGLTYAHGSGLTAAGLNAERLAGQLDQLTTPRFLSQMTLATAHRIFGADHPLPRLSQRVKHLRAVGAYLDAHPNRDWKKWLKRFPRGLDLANHLAERIDGFDDPFVKRAQLFVGMLVGRFGSTVPKGVRNLEGMSVYADYILPMVMFRMGILEYSPELAAKIQGGVEIKDHSREELELRASTLVAADHLRTALRAKERYRALTVLELDAGLWLQGKEIEVPNSEMPARAFKRGEVPHHLTVSTNY